MEGVYNLYSIKIMDIKYLYKDLPDSLTPEFMEYLVANNVVVFSSEYFLGVENCKYGKDHLTFFSYEPCTKLYELSADHLESMKLITSHYPDHFFYINNPTNKTIDRFHFHLVKERGDLIKIF